MTPPLSLFHHIVNCAAAFHDAHEIIIVQLSSLIILLDLEWRHLTLLLLLFLAIHRLVCLAENIGVCISLHFLILLNVKLTVKVTRF